MKMVILLFVFFLFFSCEKNEQTQPASTLVDYESEHESFDLEEDAEPFFLSSLASTFETSVRFYNVSFIDQKKFEEALEVIKDVIATEDFKRAVLYHTYQNERTFVDHGGLSNTEIYQIILEGAEKLRPQKNNQMDMDVELYYEFSSTVGYTYTNSMKVFVNQKYFNNYSVESVAANLMHEWLHKLGFKHDKYYSVSRDYSVPYAIGRIISRIGRTL